MKKIVEVKKLTDIERSEVSRYYLIILVCAALVIVSMILGLYLLIPVFIVVALWATIEINKLLGYPLLNKRR